MQKVRFYSVGLRRLGPLPDPGVRQGTLAWIVDGGAGVLEHDAGRIVSKFVVSDRGEQTDRQLGVLCVEP